MRRSIATLALAAMILSGCGNTATNTPSPTLEPSVPATTPTPSTPTPAPSTAEPTQPTETATPATSEYPPPTGGKAVYDVAGVLDDETEAALEAQIDGIEIDTQLSVVLYLDSNPAATIENNLAGARSLMDQWQIGGTGGNGLVILVSFDQSNIHGILSTWAGAGMLEVFSEDAQATLRDEVMIPTFRSDSIPAGIVAGIQYVDDTLRQSLAPR